MSDVQTLGHRSVQRINDLIHVTGDRSDGVKLAAELIGDEPVVDSPANMALRIARTRLV